MKVNEGSLSPAKSAILKCRRSRSVQYGAMLKKHNARLDALELQTQYYRRRYGLLLLLQLVELPAVVFLVITHVIRR